MKPAKILKICDDENVMVYLTEGVIELWFKGVLKFENVADGESHLLGVHANELIIEESEEKNRLFEYLEDFIVTMPHLGIGRL